MLFRARQTVLSCLTAKMGIIIGLYSARGLELANITVQLCLGGGRLPFKLCQTELNPKSAVFSDLEKVGLVASDVGWSSD